MDFSSDPHRGCTSLIIWEEYSPITFDQLDHLLCEPPVPCTVPSLTGWLLMLLTPDKVPPSVSILRNFLYLPFLACLCR